MAEENEVVPQQETEWWVVIWAWRKHGTASWVIENTRLAGCIGKWWPRYVLMNAGQNDYRLMSVVPLCKFAYDQLTGIMPPAVVPKGEVMPGGGGA